MLSLFFCCLKNFDIWTILFFHDLYSCVKNFYLSLIGWFYSFMKNVSQNINFTFLQKKIIIIIKFLFYPGRAICCFDDGAFGEDLFFRCCSSSDCILWKDFYSSYDLYSCWENLYHFACRMIYIPTWGIRIILLIVWFIISLGEFESFCLSHDLYSHLGNLNHFDCRMFYTHN